ncbi:uncharacterized protein F4812DRAFT_36134 [Daldinia caldariorum]|uniref:uncharacterized protein n=1 Tax=Daldinia caldariorum TaxID=326644 RepID=UPI002008A175|nr:uncharacterized protein F4812DRAFT_36134 [Daldinia caldariorum]KAI1473016.1 hypothetical protein F4812DRAFT_36134 [Daldinia caldariorum]
MSSKKLTDFPNVEAKLHKPSKQSAFEKQKADAEAKRKREAAETAAVYESFVKSFDHDDDDDSNTGPPSRQHVAYGARPPGGPQSREGGRPAPPKRHFGTGLGGAPGLKSGPGSLGPGPTSFSSKRRFDNDQQGFNKRGAENTRGRLGFHDDDDSDDGHVSRPNKVISKVFNASDDEGDTRSRDLAEQKAIAKPTLRLANLPPGTSPAVIKALIPSNLTVENVKMLPSTTGSTERKSIAAIVTLSKETPATEIDAAVSSLQNRYLGYGFYLSLHRHLSSAVVSSTATSTLTSSSTSHPFGAKPVPQANDSNPHHPGGFHRGFAPPSSYSTAGGPISRTIFHVPVQAPKDIKQLQLIHKVIESVLAHGPEFEALLMSRPDVQKDEKWAWLWDARCEGGVWYRWRLWEVVTGGQAKVGRRGKYIPLFEGSHAWRVPEKDLPYEYATAIDEFVSDPEYNSSDEEDYEDEGHKTMDGGDNDNTYLNPLDKARLTHLLARLPTTLTKIRKGDIARVTAFAITHASRGADEIVNMIVTNVIKPFASTLANPERSRSNKNGDDNGESHNSTPFPDDATTKASETQDTSAASLIGLYVVSDILSSSATSGVRHAWRYRQLFETSLKDSNVFEILGLTAERLNWGRLRADKWKRSVKLVLSLWEGWCAFPHESQQLFNETFENPPSAKKEEQIDETAKKGKWKPVEAGASVTTQTEGKGFVSLSTAGELRHDEETSKMEIDDVDGEAMDEDMFINEADMDTDIDGVPMDDSEDGEPMDESVVTVAERDGSAANAEDKARESNEGKGNEGKDKASSSNLSTEQSTESQTRRRMRAVDMFADSDNEKQ